ncbi:prenyltransferase [Streptomyces sp. NBC_00872]|uniref:prenyltransferase n=1 Tax=Streptomyces sp. NBC_00872 TaxID=2903686 RepID=UPI0038669BC0|nr:prenyltransferase [Streptomyces sp. NBC_00872]
MAGRGPDATEHLVLPGVLTAEQAAETVAGILAVQHRDGAIPWFRGHHLDPWDHVEAAMALDAAGEHTAAARAYEWLARHQNEDGSWYAAYENPAWAGAEGARGDGGGTTGADPRHTADPGHTARSGHTAEPGHTIAVPGDPGRETNFVAYAAVGVWHHYLATGDDAFLDRMWPVVHAAIEFVLVLQQPGGQIGWKREADGTPVDDALLTGSSSVHQALRCALAIAEEREEPQPDWELAAGALGHAIRRHPERFLDKSRYSMDWYYPVLGGAVTGAQATARIAAGWDRFVVPGLGVRCVVPNPWVTGGESCELALALWVMGESDRALEVLQSIQHLRAEGGMYWTGYVFEGNRAVWPEELTTWTAGSLLLAVAALGGDEATTAVFGGERLPRGLDPDCCR